ncbi:MAG TPA: 3-hydroxyacyl-CoA dehydrogenase family protein, partial [Gaiellaceae bacterium]
AEARDFPGCVSNRVLMPFINEAAYALMDGVAEAEAIDTIAKLGFAHPMGPLALADLIGLDTCVAIMEVLHEGLGDDKYAPCPSCGSTSPRGDLVASPAAGSTTTTPTRSFDGRASGR